MMDIEPAMSVAGPATGRRTRWSGASIVLGQCVFIAVCLFVFLRGWDRDFSVPFRFSVDALVAEAQSKSTVDNGWWWFNPKIGAPFGLDELQFPTNSNVDQAVVWIVSKVVGDPATVINIAWLVMVVLSGVSATWCMQKMGVSRASAFVAGTLFALTPFALYRSLGHLWMVIYLVPFVCTAAWLLASGRPDRWYWGRPWLALLSGCGLIGFNYVYYAFFACFVLIVASVTGYLQHGAGRLLGAGALCVALVAGGTLVNLAPSLYSWHQHGTPLIVREKGPAESELYGLKIRQLVSPGLWHRFPPFRAWLAREQAAAFPLETENGSSRLGVVGTLGFLALLGTLFVPRVTQGLESGETLLAASRLTLAAVLLATVGGFGSLFSLLVSPEIRAYNRISPFITFFSLGAVALALDSLFASRTSRAVAVLTMALVGLADQRAATVYMNSIHKETAAEVASLRSLVRGLESRLPADAMVFELPLRTYLNDDGVARMQPYDHLKPYLVSRSLRWSYPALTNQQVRWQQAAALLDPQRLVRELVAGGFAAILVDRYGFLDNGAAMVSALQEPSGQEAVLGETARYVVLDIRRHGSAAPATSFLSRAASSSPATAGVAACGGQTDFYIDRIGPARAPFGAEPLHLSASGELRVSGWAVDRVAETSAAGVDLLMDQTPFQTIYGTDRGDVAGHFTRPGYLHSGFVASIPAARFVKGPHTLALRVVAADEQCYYQTPAQPLLVD